MGYRLSERHHQQNEDTERPESGRSNADGCHRRGNNSWGDRADGRPVGFRDSDRQTFAKDYLEARYMARRSNYIDSMQELKYEGRTRRPGKLYLEYCLRRDREAERMGDMDN